MQEAGATTMDINPTRGSQWRIRNRAGSRTADFPAHFYYEGVAPRTPMTQKSY